MRIMRKDAHVPGLSGTGQTGRRSEPNEKKREQARQTQTKAGPHNDNENRPTGSQVILSWSLALLGECRVRGRGGPGLFLWIQAEVKCFRLFLVIQCNYRDSDEPDSTGFFCYVLAILPVVGKMRNIILHSMLRLTC